MDSEPKPMDPERLARLRSHANGETVLRFIREELVELLADRDHHAKRAEQAETELAAINKTGHDLARVLGEDDPHHPLDVLAASVMHQLREARAEVAQLRARVEADDVGREDLARSVEGLGSEWTPSPGNEVARGWSKILREQLHKAAAMIRCGKVLP